MSAGWKSVSAKAPCPACEGTDRCSWKEDLLHCFRTQVAPEGMRFVHPSKSDERGAIFAPAKTPKAVSKAMIPCERVRPKMRWPISTDSVVTAMTACLILSCIAT